MVVLQTCLLSPSSYALCAAPLPSAPPLTISLNVCVDLQASCSGHAGTVGDTVHLLWSLRGFLVMSPADVAGLTVCVWQLLPRARALRSCALRSACRQLCCSLCYACSFVPIFGTLFVQERGEFQHDLQCGTLSACAWILCGHALCLDCGLGRLGDGCTWPMQQKVALVLTSPCCVLIFISRAALRWAMAAPSCGAWRVVHNTELLCVGAWHLGIKQPTERTGVHCVLTACV